MLKSCACRLLLAPSGALRAVVLSKSRIWRLFYSDHGVPQFSRFTPGVWSGGLLRSGYWPNTGSNMVPPLTLNHLPVGIEPPSETFDAVFRMNRSPISVRCCPNASSSAGVTLAAAPSFFNTCRPPGQQKTSA